MSSSLAYLFVTTKKNAVRRFFAGLRKPRKLLGLVVTLGLFAMVAWSITRAAGSEENAAAASVPMLRAYLALVLVMSLLGGLSERGIPFSPAEVDFLFPGPFRRRALVLYHLAGLLPVSLVGAVLPFAFFGLRAPHPGLAFVGCALASLVGQHVRLFASLAVIHLGERAFRRLKAPVRFAMVALTLGVIGLLMASGTGGGGMREAIAKFAGSEAARWLLYPAVVAGDLAEADGIGSAVVPLLGAAAAALLTLVPVLLLQVNFLEESIGASERNAARRARMRRSRNLAAVTAGERPVRTVRLPALPVFRGAGALAWKNLVVARRSLRSLFFSTIFLLLVFVPAITGPERRGAFPLAMAALFPMLLSGSIAFDFRGEGSQMATLKALPLSPTAVALAEIAVPTAIILLFQAVYLLALAAVGRVGVGWAALAWLGCFPVSATMVAATNLAWLFGPKGAGASLLQILFLAADLAILAAVAWALGSAGADLWVVVPVLAAAQVALLSGVLALLGVAFTSHDVADEVT